MTRPDNDELEFEAPEADAAEQALDAAPAEPDGVPSLDLEAPEWDAQEQARTVQFEDEYR